MYSSPALPFLFLKPLLQCVAALLLASMLAACGSENEPDTEFVKQTLTQRDLSNRASPPVTLERASFLQVKNITIKWVPVTERRLRGTAEVNVEVTAPVYGPYPSSPAREKRLYKTRNRIEEKRQKAQYLPEPLRSDLLRDEPEFTKARFYRVLYRPGDKLRETLDLSAWTNVQSGRPEWAISWYYTGHNTIAEAIAKESMSSGEFFTPLHDIDGDSQAAEELLAAYTLAGAEYENKIDRALQSILLQEGRFFFHADSAWGLLLEKVDLKNDIFTGRYFDFNAKVEAPFTGRILPKNEKSTIALEVSHDGPQPAVKMFVFGEPSYRDPDPFLAHIMHKGSKGEAVTTIMEQGDGAMLKKQLAVYGMESPTIKRATQ